MIVEIKNVLVNTNSILTVEQYADRLYLLITFVNSSSFKMNFENIEDLNVAYLTLKMVETMTKYKA